MSVGSSGDSSLEDRVKELERICFAQHEQLRDLAKSVRDLQAELEHAKTKTAEGLELVGDESAWLRSMVEYHSQWLRWLSQRVEQLWWQDAGEKSGQ